MPTASKPTDLSDIREQLVQHRLTLESIQQTQKGMQSLQREMVQAMKELVRIDAQNAAINKSLESAWTEIRSIRDKQATALWRLAFLTGTVSAALSVGLIKTIGG